MSGSQDLTSKRISKIGIDFTAEQVSKEDIILSTQFHEDLENKLAEKEAEDRREKQSIFVGVDTTTKVK